MMELEQTTETVTIEAEVAKLWTIKPLPSFDQIMELLRQPIQGAARREIIRYLGMNCIAFDDAGEERVLSFLREFPEDGDYFIRHVDMPYSFAKLLPRIEDEQVRESLGIRLLDKASDGSETIYVAFQVPTLQERVWFYLECCDLRAHADVLAELAQASPRLRERIVRHFLEDPKYQLMPAPLRVGLTMPLLANKVADRFLMGSEDADVLFEVAESDLVTLGRRQTACKIIASQISSA